MISFFDGLSCIFDSKVIWIHKNEIMYPQVRIFEVLWLINCFKFPRKTKLQKMGQLIKNKQTNEQTNKQNVLLMIVMSPLSFIKCLKLTEVIQVDNWFTTNQRSLTIYTFYTTAIVFFSFFPPILFHFFVGKHSRIKKKRIWFKRLYLLFPLWFYLIHFPLKFKGKFVNVTFNGQIFFIFVLTTSL